MDLSAQEARVLGCMMEKRITTPDIYPLTLNSLRLACNQSTNRDPVVSYDDAILRDALHRLERRGYARLASGRGSRAPKYRHLLVDALPMQGDEHALLCVLLLRGQQTPGELKQRADRMHEFASLEAVNDTLERLIARGLAARLPRRPGQKEERYEHLMSADAEDPRPRADRERPLLAPPIAAQAGVGGGPAQAGVGGGPAQAGVGAGPAQADAGSARAYAGEARRAADGVRSGEYGAAVHDISHRAGGLAGAASLEALEARVAQLEREVAELRARTGAARVT
jgi:uncharacterized protein